MASTMVGYTAGPKQHPTYNEVSLDKLSFWFKVTLYWPVSFVMGNDDWKLIC